MVSSCEKGQYFYLNIYTTLTKILSSTLLKSDQWIKESRQVTDGVRGAINFRRIPGTEIYALGQPTLDAIDEVVARVKQDNPSAERILWITLREEPIVYINGAPYCLRRERFSLRNMKGILELSMLNSTNANMWPRLWRDLCVSPRSARRASERRRYFRTSFLRWQVGTFNLVRPLAHMIVCKAFIAHRDI